ncbi:hypothetical protein NUW58_g1202 [Xylaria curta]|uniref:Uncharacterized protein n=1 Tax=Xylaria curta TaxID=42375 RepID=A0ACC1PNC4_9PEZI|nr:hypothetical protein NUW58_g1202 [Xylaria curta]
MDDTQTTKHIIHPDRDVIIRLRNPNAPFAIMQDYEKLDVSNPETVDGFGGQEWTEPPPEGVEHEPAITDVDSSAQQQSTVSAGLPEVHLQVSSAHLTFVSRYFKAALCGPFQESQLGTDGLRYIDAEDWDVEALLIVIQTIHGQNRKIPRFLGLEVLAKVAVIVGYYQCYEAIDPFPEIWLQQIKSRLLLRGFNRDLKLLLFVSWTCGWTDEFTAATRIVVRIFEHQRNTAMSSSAVTHSMRAVGWNVHFTIGQEEDPGAFAGIYQAVGSNLVTFRDVCDELRLCFEFPNDAARGESGDDNNDPWASIAFALADHPDFPNSSPLCPSFVTEELLDQPVPSLAPFRPKEQNVLKYHLVCHSHCDLPSNSPLDTHLQARCAQHLPNPVRRRDPRYLPPNKAPSDPRLTMMPLRRKLKARSQSPPKRSASDSISPRKDDSDNVDDGGLDSMVAPTSMDIDVNEAKRVINDFRSSCLNRATCCAVSGEGEPWCPGPPIGPGVQACHIVPQQHYHLYPSIGGQHCDEDSPVEESSRRLQEAWQNTWSPRNGILLMKHLHEFFDARLFSIHPRTLRIRVFVPYNALTGFNGQKASVPATIDRKALRHHYEMCCIENMAAERPNLDVASPSISRMATSGTGTPFSAGTDLSVTPSSRGTQMEIAIGRTGDPSKRSRPNPFDQSQPRDASRHDDLLEETEAAPWKGERGRKRKRSEDCQVKNETSAQYDWFQKDMPEGYITAWNNREFLADVNWELQKFKSRQLAS